MCTSTSSSNGFVVNIHSLRDRFEIAGCALYMRWNFDLGISHKNSSDLVLI
jgi:hypothetical protein